jgi:hypothetical protein
VLFQRVRGGADDEEGEDGEYVSDGEEEEVDLGFSRRGRGRLARLFHLGSVAGGGSRGGDGNGTQDVEIELNPFLSDPRGMMA